MSNPFATRPGMFTRLITVTALAGLLIGVGCSDDDDEGGSTPTPTTSFTGIFVGQGDGGKITVTISSSSASLAPGLRAAKLQFGAGGSRLLRAGSLATHDIAATGSLDLSGGSIIGLSGTYKEESDTLNLIGGGYTLIGAYDSTGSYPGILGGYLGPNGPGLFACVTGVAAQVFCGTFVNGGATVQGRWNLIVAGDDAAGAAIPYGTTDLIGMERTITGTGNPRTITFLGGQDGVSELTATGTWDTTTNMITGTWETTDGVNPLDSGTWEASPCE